MSESIRIKTTPLGNDQYIQVKVDQDFDFVKVLSLDISQEKAYQNFCSDYGVVVGRVTINNGFGVPNAKVSVFIPVDEIDKGNPQILGLYPYEKVSDTDSDGIRYNLLPQETDNQNICYTPVGTFPSKREVLDNDEMLYVFCKYYKFTTVTNYAGDFMIFGVPLGNHVVHVDADISNIGIASQRPYDLIDQGVPKENFYSTTKFKAAKNLNSLVQIKSANAGVNVRPFWGDPDNCQIGINRLDIDLNYTIRPSAIFMGSIFGDSKKNSINKNCKPRKNMGSLCEQETGEGTIEMIRKTIDNQIEQFDVNGGRNIDVNGAWAYQIPMNLDYVITDEFGNLIPSKDPNKGIPTRARVRFRISMDEEGDLGRLRTRGKYLVPHNPSSNDDLDFTFDARTKDSSFTDLYWNKIYTVKNFIARAERYNTAGKQRTYSGIKLVDNCVGDKNPFPYNRTYTKNNILYTIICIILNVLAGIVATINTFIVQPIHWLGVSYITIKCYAGDSTQTYTPFIQGEQLPGYIKCQSAGLAEALGLYQFDFYNDWINGTLYYYLLKYKKKISGSEKFCETYCNDPIIINGISGTGYNTCKDNMLVDNTYNAKNDDVLYNTFRNGLLVQFENILYYPPKVLLNSQMRMFSTDIVCLGAVLDCDWQLYPKIIQYFPNSSYKIPPLIEETPENGDAHTEVNITGMVQINGDGGLGLFFTIDCSGLNYNQTNAINIRRLSEMGIDLPESIDKITSPPSTVTIQEIYKLGDNPATSVNKYVRDSFYLLNVNGSLEEYPDPTTYDLDTPSLGTSIDIAGNSSVAITNNGSGAAYYNFRGYSTSKTDEFSPQAWQNSYYMYFGIVPNKTALNLLNSKYFVYCIPTIKDEFIIETTVSNTSTTTSNDGIINITFLGGVGPFIYTVTNSTVSYATGPTSVNMGDILTDLQSSSDPYIITATDVLGTTVVKEVVVSGPLGLECSFNIQKSPTTLISYDGTIIISSLNGGKPPYNLNIVGPNFNFIKSNITLLDSPIKNIGVGNYVITITDVNGDTCGTTLNITTVAPISIQTPVYVDNISTSNSCTGGISPFIDGGVEPINVTITNGSTYTQTYPYANMRFINLCSGNYTITAVDSLGQTATANATVLGPNSNTGGSTSTTPFSVTGVKTVVSANPRGTQTSMASFTFTGGAIPYKLIQPVSSGPIYNNTYSFNFLDNGTARLYVFVDNNNVQATITL